MELLLNNNANVNERDIEGKTPLHTVIQKGYLDCAQLLIERGADVNAGDSGSLYHLSNFNSHSRLDSTS